LSSTAEDSFVITLTCFCRRRLTMADDSYITHVLSLAWFSVEA